MHCVLPTPQTPRTTSSVFARDEREEDTCSHGNKMEITAAAEGVPSKPLSQSAWDGIGALCQSTRGASLTGGVVTLACQRGQFGLGGTRIVGQEGTEQPACSMQHLQGRQVMRHWDSELGVLVVLWMGDADRSWRAPSRPSHHAHGLLGSVHLGVHRSNGPYSLHRPGAFRETFAPHIPRTTPPNERAEGRKRRQVNANSLQATMPPPVFPNRLRSYAQIRANEPRCETIATRNARTGSSSHDTPFCKAWVPWNLGVRGEGVLITLPTSFNHHDRRDTRNGHFSVRDGAVLRAGRFFELRASRTRRCVHETTKFTLLQASMFLPHTFSSKRLGSKENESGTALSRAEGFRIATSARQLPT